MDEITFQGVNTMKKIAVVASGLALLSTSAFATRARMEALGQNQSQGSFFMRDTRTIFRNASHINDQKNYIVAEIGDSAFTNSGANGIAEAEGGFVKDAGKFVYGVMLNFQRDDAAAIGTVDANLNGITTDAADKVFLGEDQRIDLFFGGDAGIQWGLNIAYAHQSDENLDSNDSVDTALGGAAGAVDGASYNYIGVNLGMTMGDIEGWLNLDITEEAEGAIEDGDGTVVALSSSQMTSEGDFAFQVGFSYAHRDMVYYVEYDRDGNESNLQTGNNAVIEFKETEFTLGVAKMMEINEKSRWFWDVALRLDEQETTLQQQSITVDNNDLTFTVGFESDVKSWLTLRGSIAQQVLYSRLDTQIITNASTGTSDDNTQFSTTSANAGATIRLGDIAVDGVLGVNENNTAATFSKNGRVGFGDDFFSRVALTYNF